MKNLIYLLITVFLFSNALSSEITNLIEFHPNTTAKSSEVNQNFNTIKNAVNDNNSRIEQLNNSINKNSINIQSIKDAINDINSKTQQLKDTVDKHNADIKLINDSVGNHETRIEKLESSSTERGIKTINNVGNTGAETNVNVNFTSSNGSIKITPNPSTKEINLEVSKSFNNRISAIEDYIQQLDTVFMYLRERALKCTVISFYEVAKRFNNNIALDISKITKEAVDERVYEDESSFATFLQALISQELNLANSLSGIASQKSLDGYISAVNEVQASIDSNDILKSAALQDEVCFYALQLEEGKEENNCEKTLNCNLFAFRDVSIKFASKSANLIADSIDNAIKSNICNDENQTKNFISILPLNNVLSDIQISATTNTYNNFSDAVNQLNTQLSTGTFENMLNSFANVCDKALKLEKKQLVTVPNLVGLNINDAKTQIAKAGLTIGTITTQVDNTKPAGTVLSQDPLPGVKVYSGTPVNLAISTTGDSLITVPNVVGLSVNDAKTQIALAGLTIGTITTQVDNTKPAGTVLSQDPLSGTKVAPKTPVNLVISTTNDSLVVVPDVRGYETGTAYEILTLSGLDVGNITYQPDNTKPYGIVLDQDPKPGTIVEPGSLVDLVVVDNSGG